MTEENKPREVLGCSSMKTFDGFEKPDWDRLENDVVSRIRVLRALWEQWDDCEVKVDGTETKIQDTFGPSLKHEVLVHKVLVDLIVPNLELLATFCLSVTIEEI